MNTVEARATYKNCQQRYPGLYPDFNGWIDQDVLDKFNGSWGDVSDEAVINAQLIKTNNKLLESLDYLISLKENN